MMTPHFRVLAAVSAIIAVFSVAGFGMETKATVVTPKKGIAVGKFGPANMVTANASWYYNWTNNPPSGSVPTGVTPPEYVPMLWGANWVTDANITALKTAQASGKYKNLLGFNEPDMGGQANMTVAQAISLWPKLQQTNLRLGSPACSYTNQWFSDFMTAAATNNLRVDFICLHTYRAPNVAGTVSGIKQWITDTYNKYKKPIWLTEFGAPDCKTLGWCGTAPALTQAQVDAYVKEVIAMLEDCPYVERYAWFMDLSGEAGFALSSLFKSDGTLSQTGIDFRDAKGTAIVREGSNRTPGAAALRPSFREREGAIVCHLPGHANSYRVALFDCAGRCVARAMGSGAGEVVMTRSRIAKGLYLGLVESGAGSTRVRFFVQ
jgi:hypothetical protein